MAAIADPSQATDLAKLVKDMEKALPPYARPVFLRFLPEVNKTGKVRPKYLTDVHVQRLVL